MPFKVLKHLPICVGKVETAIKDKWQMNMLSWAKRCGRASTDLWHQKIFGFVFVPEAQYVDD